MAFLQVAGHKFRLLKRKSRATRSEPFLLQLQEPISETCHDKVLGEILGNTQHGPGLSLCTQAKAIGAFEFYRMPTVIVLNRDQPAN